LTAGQFAIFGDIKRVSLPPKWDEAR
jgi:hypothetical protein